MKARLPPARGFSLLETMIVVAIVGVLTALAVPNLLPVLHVERLAGAAESVASFVGEARARAMSDRRCVRVRVIAPTPPATAYTLVSERRNSFDCDDDTSLPLIDGGLPAWVELRRMRLDNDALVVAFDPAPTEPVNPSNELRYRPSGRLFSSDRVLNDDDGVLRLTHPGITNGPNFKKVLFDAHGPICVMGRGQEPISAGANDLACPP